MAQKHRYNELKEEHGELWFINDFAEIKEVHGLEKDNEPMLRVYRDSPGSVHLQVRTFAPITDKLTGKGKPRNMIATVSIGLKELALIDAYVRKELGGMYKGGWQASLSEGQKRHLDEAKVETISDFAKNREGQKNSGIRCMDCEAIERQLVKAGIL